MSEPESTICQQCGGALGVTHGKVLLTPSDAQSKVKFVADDGALACIGHTGFEQKHDGNLSENERVSIWRYTEHYSDVFIEDKLGTGENKHLTIAEALSLLAWLRQEEQELKRLAEGQE